MAHIHNGYKMRFLSNSAHNATFFVFFFFFVLVRYCSFVPRMSSTLIFLHETPNVHIIFQCFNAYHLILALRYYSNLVNTFIWIEFLVFIEITLLPSLPSRALNSNTRIPIKTFSINNIYSNITSITFNPFFFLFYSEQQRSLRSQIFCMWKMCADGSFLFPFVHVPPM